MTNYLLKTISLTVALFTLAGTATMAQSQMASEDSKAFRNALKLADKTNNREAIGILRRLYDKYPDNLGVAYNLGICYINASGNPDSTLFFLNRVKELDDNDSWDETRIELNLAIARAHQLCGHPQEALAIYDEIEKADVHKTYAEMIRHERDVCSSAVVLMKQPVRLVMRDAGKDVNSDNNDYRPVLTANEDTMYFTSRRPKKDADKSILFDDGQYEEGVYFSVRKGNKWDGGNWGAAAQVRGLITDSRGRSGQETVTSISADGSEMYLCHDGDIYVSHRDEATNKWLPATPLPEPVNSVYNEDFAFITPDGENLYISSDCPGGYGGKDIYVSRRLPNGQWGEPLNLGPGVNTEEDEDAPFYHAQTRILYFSSKGHNGMGGYDIFYAPENENGQFEASVNLGYPINSADDDLYFAPSVDRDRAYYSSIRWNAQGHAPSYDLYEIEYEQPELNRLAVVAALVKAPDIEDVRVLTMQDGEIIGIGRPNARSGNFITIVEAGQEYDLMAYCGADTIFRHISTLKSQSYYASQTPVRIDPFDFTTSRLRAEDMSVNPIDGSEAYSVARRRDAKPDDPNPYTVQIFSLRHVLDYSRLARSLDPDSVSEYRYRSGWYVYSYGAYPTYRAAYAAQERIRNITKYDDAFARNSKQYKKFVKSEAEEAKDKKNAEAEEQQQKVVVTQPKRK